MSLGPRPDLYVRTEEDQLILPSVPRPPSRPPSLCLDLGSGPRPATESYEGSVTDLPYRLWTLEGRPRVPGGPTGRTGVTEVPCRPYDPRRLGRLSGLVTPGPDLTATLLVDDTRPGPCGPPLPSVTPTVPESIPPEIHCTSQPQSCPSQPSPTTRRKNISKSIVSDSWSIHVWGTNDDPSR